MTTALGHIKVLDLSRVMAGPWATQNLADLGAEVIKIERPGSGDDTRSWGPPYLRDDEDAETTDSSYFLSANRGKKSVTVDISTPQGQAIIRQLATEADVVVENYKVGTLARYGLAYADISAINPGVVYCSITGYGQDSPYSHLPGYDFIFQGMGGLMSITGLPPGEAGGEPMKSGLAICDLFSGMYATTAILAALEHRNVSKAGQHLDIALFDSMIGITSYQAMNYFMSGKVPQRMGNAHVNLVPYQVFDCLDGQLIVALGNDSQFVDFCTVLGCSDLSRDPDFARAGARNRNRERLLPMLSDIMRTRTIDAWVGLLEPANIPVGPILSVAQAFEHPHVRYRNLKVTLPHAAGVDVPNVANPMRFSATPIAYGHAAPMLGEHTHQILKGRLNYSDDELADLQRQGIV